MNKFLKRFLMDTEIGMSKTDESLNYLTCQNLAFNNTGK